MPLPDHSPFDHLKNMWLDKKVHELATMCLPWQHWTKALVWFDEVDIPEF
jgi:hypothetical protein